MLEWVDWAAAQVDLIANEDEAYLESRGIQEKLVDEFDRLVKGLPGIQRELVLDYLDAITEMEYRKTQLAYELGKQVGKREIHR